MLKKNKELEIEATQQGDFYVGVVERPNKYGITEELIHQKLGDIHKNKVKRLTDEEKEILRRWKEWNLKDIPEDWQTKFKNFIQISEELGQWKKYFGDKKPPEVKTEYDKPRETHTAQDLKPTNLPIDWETELGRIPELEKRPTKEGYGLIKQDLDKWTNTFKGKTLEEVKAKYDEPKKEELTKDQQEAINNYQTVKNERDKWQDTFKKKKPEDVKTDLDEKTKLSTSWHDIFGNKKPQEINEEINNLKKKLVGSFPKEEKDGYLNQIKQLEKLLSARSGRNRINEHSKKETKLCEICSQIKQDNFKYSRISAVGFNTYHFYRICSFCQKIVQTVTG